VRAAVVPPGPSDDRARLERAVAAVPSDPAPRRALAALLARAGEHQAAFEQYRALLDLLPGEPDVAANSGLMAVKVRREEEVLPLVRKAADANPRHARVWQVVGLLYRALDELEPAIAALEQAASLAPADPLIGHARARAHFEAGRPAARYFQQLRSSRPDDKALILGHMAALIAERRTGEATEMLAAELSKNPNWAEGHAVLARHLWSLGDRTGFTASLEAALRASPRNMDLWRELIVALMHNNAHQDALEVIARGRAIAGPHPVFDANEAACQSELGNDDRADALFDELAALRNPMVMVRHVRHLLRTGRPREAEKIARPMTETGFATDFWPYLSIAWRMTEDARWEWLEGDPRLVGVYDLAGSIPSLDALADCLRALHVTTHQPLEQSLRGGTQTDGYLFARVEPEIRALRQAIVDAVREHVAQLPPPDPRHPQLGAPRGPIRFTGAWSVRLTSGGCHANHLHPAGWFSSAFYVALPDESARGGREAGWLTLGEPQAELGLDLAPFRTIEPKPGRLALFPSTMWHGTRPFLEGERLTVAFDVMRPQP
jgi:Flp pilus assembly protein TadD